MPGSAIDPFGSKIDIYQARANSIIASADKSFAQSVCRFLNALKESPPNSPEQIERLLTFWRSKEKELEN